MHLVLLVEEQSMETFLRTLLARFLPENTTHEIHAFQGKSDLKRKLAARLRAYARWLPDDWRIFVLVDRDNDECRALKNQLEETAQRAGLRTPSRDLPWQLANRIVIQELEAWYFGNWQAVQRVYPRVSPRIPYQRGYRDPEGVDHTWEAFERILQRYGYFTGGLRKNEAARAIAEQIDPGENRSRSFDLFYRTVMELVPAGGL